MSGALTHNRVVEGMRIVDEMLTEFSAIYPEMLGILYGAGVACLTFLSDGRRARFLFEACNDLLLTWRMTGAPLDLRNSIMLNLALLADGYSRKSEGVSSARGHMENGRRRIRCADDAYGCAR